MDYIHLYFLNLATVVGFMTILWFISIYLKNVSIVDLFWGAGFVLSALVYYLGSEGVGTRNLLLLILVAAWGLRLSIYLAWRNIGKGEDFRYREFRRQYGEHRYWWISYFQTFLLQGVLMWLISAPLLGAQFNSVHQQLSFLDLVGIIVWAIGFTFEAGGDWQLARFRSNPLNKGKVLDQGFWRYTRHPNYFGDAAVWWGFAIFSISSGNILPVLGSILMTALIIKVSGISLLEKSLKSNKPEYIDYIRKTSAFIPWFPKK
jgi:steroid 5-alpha reductase family enzyme